MAVAYATLGLADIDDAPHLAQHLMCSPCESWCNNPALDAFLVHWYESIQFLVSTNSVTKAANALKPLKPAQKQRTLRTAELRHSLQCATCTALFCSHQPRNSLTRISTPQRNRPVFSRNNHATMKESNTPRASFLAPLNQRLSPTWHLRMYKFPSEPTVALIN